MNIPTSRPLQGDTKPIPFMVVADDAFPLKTYLQKPYSQIGLAREKRIYNYRLSRARRIVDIAKGLRDYLKDYFSQIGTVAWQDNMI